MDLSAVNFKSGIAVNGSMNGTIGSELISHYNTSNVTETVDPWKEDVKFILDMLLLLVLIFIMLAMGCEITLPNLWGHIKRPIGLSIGILSQFGLKPLAAYAVLLLSGVSGLHATGTLIISCCPGGVLSNTFTYFCDGDLPLSVAMTTASTIMAMGMLPANIWLYGRKFESVDLVIPYQKMCVSLIIVVSPIAVGLLLKWKFPTIAKWTTKIGTYTGLLLMLICGVIEAIVFPSMFTSVPLKLYMIVLALPVVGLAIGYGVAAILRQNAPVRKTIAIECGVQNFPLALTVITLSFPLEMQEDIVLLPWLYGIAMIIGCSIICAFYHLCKKLEGRGYLPAKLEGRGYLPAKLDSNALKDVEILEQEDLMNGNPLSIKIMPSKNSTRNDDSIKI